MPLVTEWAVFMWLMISGTVTPSLIYVENVTQCTDIATDIRTNPLPQVTEGEAHCINMKVVIAHTTAYMQNTVQETEYVWFNPYWSGGGPLRQTEGINYGWDQMKLSAHYPTREDAKIYD